MDQSMQSWMIDPQNWWELLNLKPINGALKQTPLITSFLTLNALDAEPTSPVRFFTLTQDAAGTPKFFILTENRARYMAPQVSGLETKIPFVLQVTIPNDSAITGEALLYGTNTTDFSADSDQITVETLSGTTARWRKNAGSWTTFTIALDQGLAGTSLRLSFLATTGFPTGSIWVWARQAAPPYAGTYAAWPVQTAAYNRDIYVAGLDRTILRLRDTCMTSVGYRRVYGRFVQVFYNHLVVGQYAPAYYNSGFPSDSVAQATTPWRVGWSDLNNPDEFYATDINEADVYDVPSNNSALDTPYPGITGMEKWGNQLIIFLSDEMLQMNYVGLPRVMKIDPLNLGVGCMYPGTIVRTPQGLFFWSRDNICVFTGQGVRKIGYPVRDKLFSELSYISVWFDKRQQTFGFYDQDNSEIIWTYWIWLGGTSYQQRQVCYQLDYNRFYFRNIPSEASGAAGDIRAMARSYDMLGQLLYGTKGLIHRDYGFDGTSLVDALTDIATLPLGTPTYTNPSATTPDIIYGNLHDTKELDRFYIDASYGTTGGFTTGVQLGYAVRNGLHQAVNFTTASETWTTSLRNLSLPRTAGRIFRYKFTFSGSKAHDCRLNGWGDFLLQTKAEQ